MPVYNKLKIAIFTIISSQSIHALTLEPVEILSGSGNLLYAEMKFSNADANARIEASLAETQDLVRLGVAHQRNQMQCAFGWAGGRGIYNGFLVH